MTPFFTVPGGDLSKWGKEGQGKWKVNTKRLVEKIKRESCCNSPLTHRHLKKTDRIADRLHLNLAFAILGHEPLSLQRLLFERGLDSPVLC